MMKLIEYLTKQKRVLKLRDSMRPVQESKTRFSKKSLLRFLKMKAQLRLLLPQKQLKNKRRT
jgi:hypothetical protein